MTIDRALDLAIAFTTLVFIIHGLALFWAALFRLEQIEQALENSKFLRDTKRQWENAGLVGLQYRLAMASAEGVRNFVFGHNMSKRCMYANQKETRVTRTPENPERAA